MQGHDGVASYSLALRSRRRVDRGTLQGESAIVPRLCSPVPHPCTTRYEWSRLFRRTLGRAADQRRRFRGLPAAPPLVFWTAASSAKLPLKMLFAAVHMSLNGTSRTSHNVRFCAAVGG